MKTEILLAERARTQQALQSSEERYKRLLEATTDYIYTVQVQGARKEATFHSPGCEPVTGYTPAEFAADPFLWYRMIHEEDRSAVLNQVNRILEGGLPPPLEHRIRHKRGGIRWVQNTPIPHRDAHGRLIGYDGLISDITERRLAEEALRESQERLALVIQGSNDGIWDWNVTTGECYFSARWKSMLGYREDEVEDKFSGWETLLHPEDRPRALALLQDYFSGRVPTYELEARLRQKDGSYRWVLARGAALRNAEGKPVRMLGSHVDLSERKEAAERLEKAYARLANREAALKRTLHELRASHRELEATQLKLIQAAKFESVGTLAAGVAHEVKNPLQTIMMGVDFLCRKIPGSDEALAQALTDIRDATKRADSIVRELLALSVETAFSRKPEDLNELLDRALLLLNNEFTKTQTTVQRDLGSDLPLVPMDRTKIEQVFINLFVNGLQAMQKSGTLTVSTRVVTVGSQPASVVPLLRGFRPGERAVIAEVTDTGSGIAPENLSRIFDPFFTTKPVGVGTGLGLSVAKKIIDLHSGAIEVANSPGGGAVARVVLRADGWGNNEPAKEPVQAVDDESSIERLPGMKQEGAVG